MFLPIDSHLETRRWELPASSWAIPLLTYYAVMLALGVLLLV